MLCKTKNRCRIKYIHLKAEAINTELHDPAEFEFCQTTIEHSTYDELREQAFEKCPAGYSCIEPIALRHEVLWGLGLNLIKDELGNVVPERDHLLHALEAEEYGLLAWNRTDDGEDDSEIISLCVDIVLKGDETSSCPDSRAFQTLG